LFDYRESWNWFIVIIVILLRQINGHGRMEDPPARNAAWRYGKYLHFIFPKRLVFLGFDVPSNYDDVGLNCGGLSLQKTNGRDY
jgi:hypothetical protein